MEIYLVDGTYELFRHYFALPPAQDAEGREVAAVRGVLTSMLGLINSGATHLGVATDHVIESFRNRLWRGYKTSAGVPANLMSQFQLLEDALTELGVVVWPMVEFEADDALAAAAERAAADPRVTRVVICTPDKDLSQSVRGTRVVQLNRRTREFRDEAGVIAKFGVPPSAIPDYLALVGDSSDGYPGLPGWGPKSAAAGTGTLRSPGGHPGRLARVARQRREPRRAGRHLRARARSRAALPNAGDVADRCAGVRSRGRPCLARAAARLLGLRRKARSGWWGVQSSTRATRQGPGNTARPAVTGAPPEVFTRDTNVKTLYRLA